jgi:hypothetical protein
MAESDGMWACGWPQAGLYDKARALVADMLQNGLSCDERTFVALITAAAGSNQSPPVIHEIEREIDSRGACTIRCTVIHAVRSCTPMAPVDAWCLADYLNSCLQSVCSGNADWFGCLRTGSQHRVGHRAHKWLPQSAICCSSRGRVCANESQRKCPTEPSDAQFNDGGACRKRSTAFLWVPPRPTVRRDGGSRHCTN